MTKADYYVQQRKKAKKNCLTNEEKRNLKRETALIVNTTDYITVKDDEPTYY